MCCIPRRPIKLLLSENSRIRFPLPTRTRPALKEHPHTAQQVQSLGDNLSSLYTAQRANAQQAVAFFSMRKCFSEETALLLPAWSGSVTLRIFSPPRWRCVICGRAAGRDRLHSCRVSARGAFSHKRGCDLSVVSQSAFSSKKQTTTTTTKVCRIFKFTLFFLLNMIAIFSPNFYKNTKIFIRMAFRSSVETKSP